MQRIVNPVVVGSIPTLSAKTLRKEMINNSDGRVREMRCLVNGVLDVQPPRGILRVILIEHKTVIVMAECAINGVMHKPKELEVAPRESRWTYIRGLVSR